MRYRESDYSELSGDTKSFGDISGAFFVHDGHAVSL